MKKIKYKLKALGRFAMNREVGIVKLKNLIEKNFHEEECGAILNTKWWLTMKVKLYLPKPNACERRYQMDSTMPPYTRPRMGLIIDTVERALQGIVFYDREQVYKMSVQKYYDNVPRIEIEIEGEQE